MKRSVTFKGLAINHGGWGCENHCRFCTIWRQRPNRIELDRVINLVDRLRLWRDANQKPEFRVFINYFLSMNYDRETLEAMQALRKRLNEFEIELLMGGIVHMPDDELRRWLEERRDAGINVIRLSLAGTREAHDHWVVRQGDFDFNLRAARIAAELGFRRHEWILVSRSIIPQLEDLIDQLDQIPGRQYRGFRLMGLGDSSKLSTQELMTRGDFNRLPEWVRRDFQHVQFIKSEREWIDEPPPSAASEMAEAFYLILKIEDRNFARMESASCDEIMADLEQRSRQVYEAVPTFAELARRYGNPDNDRLYWKSGIEHEWVNRFVAASGVRLEKGLTWIY